MALDIYVHKQGAEGASPLNPESPVNEAATNASRIAIKKTTLLGYGKLLANRTFNTIAQELRASGNERAATQLGNVSRGANMLVGVIATKGLSLIPQTVNAIAEQVVIQRTATRETKRAEIENRLKGGRSNFTQGRVYFD